MDDSVYLNDIWQEVLVFLKQDPEVGQGKVNIWFGLVKPVSFDREKGILKISVPNSMHRNTIHARFEGKITSFLKDLICQPAISLVYELNDPESAAANNENAVSASSGSPDKTSAAEQANILSESLSAPKNSTENANAAANAAKHAFTQPMRDTKSSQPDASNDSILNAPWQPSIVRNQFKKDNFAETAAHPDPNAFHPSFRPDLTFESFIEGPSNRFALGAAKAVVKEGISPLFIYSKPGLGKTHLLYAIAHGLYRKNQKVKILYTDAENYVNEYLKAIPENKTDAFREKYRNQDCFLIDDVQFLLGKERSVEEFFHTFKTFLDSKKLIVITSDKPPNEMALDERIMSRFRSGVIADIKLPDYETRVAILQQINSMNNYGIPDDVINFIAEKVHKGGRDLGGCLLTVKEFCALTDAKPTIDIAKSKIKDMMSSQQDGPINIKTILNVVAESYNINVQDLVSTNREQRFTAPRHIAMYLTKELTNMVYEDIGKAFGGKSHSMVITARNKIADEVKSNIYFNKHINELIEKIKNVNSQEEY